MSSRKIKACGLAEKIQNNKEFNESNWVKKEKMLGQRNNQRIPLGLGVIDDTKEYVNKKYNDVNDFITKVKYGRTDLSPKVKKILWKCNYFICPSWTETNYFSDFNDSQNFWKYFIRYSFPSLH